MPSHDRSSPSTRYSGDVLKPGWQQAGKKQSRELAVERDLVLEDPTTGFCGAVVRWENGVVVLEDRRGKKRSFPLGPGLWLEGEPVNLVVGKKQAPPKALTHTASGSRRGTPTRQAKVALPSRIYVEGRHDAELVEKIWGDDLRHVGVVVEYLGGIDDLPEIVAKFAPEQGRRLGVLADHLVPGSKEQRIADEVARGRYAEWVFVTGHRFIDIWAAIKPERVGLNAWPDIPRGTDWKSGILDHLGLPHRNQTDIAKAWQMLLGKVNSWSDLDPKLLTEVEKLIDFVTLDHQDG
ncbi:Protein of unknown function (DUF3097) [Propionibacteriaceae bacterium ES.041]|uniref:DUF3097 domain-containing protein n=1 Tax=Enemella evansiae TaxID=2016499 RepID=A0A255G0Q6_9ACTN|nr:DUF3097 domain-containing protein [Enemella evansiae]OYO07956.1 hypothetical protein CGZ94_21120 [Enemella evansiae]PFG66562.1 Protein of unknown function (DUF3097) [Propionibacteriaceae bacterium ES.041]